MKIKVEKGLIWEQRGEQRHVIPCSAADRVAGANGFYCAEQFVDAHNGKELEIDKNLLHIIES